MNYENHNTEYKETWHDEYLKWICGFANAQGGKLYIGIDDQGNVCGIANAHKLSEDIPNKIVAFLGIVADVNILQKDGKEYIEIDVAPSNVPISFKGVYHYRSGSTKQELNGIALQQFVLKKLGRTWDDIICEQASIEHIDRTAVDYFLRKAVDAQRLPEESLNESTENVLQNLGLVDFEGRLKNAAMLLFGKNPQRFIAGAEFKIGFFGKDDTDLIFQDLIDGNIIQMCDTVIKTLKAKYLISPIHYEGLQRIEPLEIPEDALREAIFNSIIHKDYMGPQIQMKVFRDRIELWNYGRLPEDITIEKLLGRHSSNARNKNIANAFYKAGFIEAWGRGISKIITQFANAGLETPVFEDFCGGMLVILHRNTNLVENVIESNSTDKFPKNFLKTSYKLPENLPPIMQKTFEEIANNPTATNKELGETLGLSDRTIRTHISILKSEGLIKRCGNIRSGYWLVIAPKNNE